MKKSLVKNNLKTIKRTKRRFISILIMAFLGVGFYAGLVASSPDMLDSLDRYADTSNLYDINIISTLGLTDDDINEIKKIDGIESVYGIQTKDSLTKVEDKESICKVIEYNENVNIPVVVAGRNIENENECLLDSAIIRTGKGAENYIGKKIVLENEDKDSDNNPIFTVKEFEVVGIAETPIYISGERGNTSIGNGTVSFYIFTQDNVINMDYYTGVYATVKGAKNVVTNSDEYLELVNPVVDKIENIKQTREENRYNELVNKATSKLNEAQKEFDDKKQEVDKQLEDAENKIKKAENEISASEKELKNAENEIQNQEQEANKKFEDYANQIRTGEEELYKQEDNLKIEKENLKGKKLEANSAINQINIQIANLENTLHALELQKLELERQGLDTTEVQEQINTIQATLNELKTRKSTIEAELEKYENQIILWEEQLEKTKEELKNKKIELESAKTKSASEFKKARNKINSGKIELEEGKAKLEESKEEYEKGKKEAQEKLDEAQEKLNDAKEEIKKIEKCKWYIQDRLDNTGYTNIFDAIKTMSNISKMFPIIFYLVSVLISLTSMTRMIEEERVEIGTLKALGYTNMQIISKYIIYSILACIIGGILGMTVGLYLIPSIVWALYDMIYNILKFYCTYRLSIGLIGIIISFICIGGATIIVAKKELREMPSVLMRPKPPKKGKRILLEKIPFIWRKFNFSQKVTARNIFRYKKRAIMTIIGIAGCTGLMLTGFGIKDSVLDIPIAQFEGIFKYDSAISLLNTNGLPDIEKYVVSDDNIEEYVEICATAGKLSNEKINCNVTVLVPESLENYDKVYNLINYQSNENIKLNNNGIIITDKAADMLGVTYGDYITFIDGDDIRYQFKVENMTKNHVGHYVYMSKEFYEENMKPYKTNMIYLNTKDISEAEQNKISEDILNIEGVASVTVISTFMKTVSDMLNTMNYVVVILIVASALLAFVVLYNLANINIAERQREIATLKVLGFHDKEVDNYINKENIIFTVIGVILGLIFGTFLTTGIIDSIEIDSLRLMKNITVLSYIYSATITITFSFIVNCIIHFVLKKIDMIESLKSVE